jgi:RNA polymerase sigma-70 factor (ECF subfamily)
MSAGEDRLEHLAGTVGPDVLAYLARRTDPVADAADVYAEVLAVTWRRLPVVPPDDREAFAWMLGVARRCLANHRRGGVRRSRLADRLRDALPAATTMPDSDARLDAERALATLSAEDRELVTLVYWEGLSVREAAGVLGLADAAARKRLSRARESLRSCLAPG